MSFKRQWDSSCPRVWDRWEADGVTWVIQDLPPEDDEEALQLLLDHLCPDEVLCIESGMVQDATSMRSMAEYWRACLAQRVSLACYAARAGAARELAAVNCCIVTSEGENDGLPQAEGEAWINVHGGLKYAGGKVDEYKYLGVDRVLYGMGLVVRTEYRGAKLGAKVLAAREPLCLSLGIKATSTVFTGVASQKCAAKAGFEAVADVTMTELAESGLKYPRNDRVIKLMFKKYTH